MRFRRALLVADTRADPAAAVAALRGVAPGLERLVVVARERGLERWWPGAHRAATDTRAAARLEAWRALAATAAPSVELHPVPGLSSDAVVDLALGEDVDLVAAGARSLELARLVTEVGRRTITPALWPASTAAGVTVRRLFCIALGERAIAAVAELAREHLDASHEAAVLGPATLTPHALAAALGVLGIGARVEVIQRTFLPLGRALDAAARRGPVDLVVIARASPLLLLSRAWTVPVLLVPVTAAGGARQVPLDVTDAVVIDGAIRARFDAVTAAGTLAPAADVELAFTWQGRVVARERTRDTGDVTLTDPPARPGVLGAARVTDDDAPSDGLAASAQPFRVLRPGERPLVLFDAELPDERLAMVLRQAADRDAVAIRLRPTRRASALSRRLDALGFACPIVDARVVLDEGDAPDVALANDPVRLMRVAARLRAAGFTVAEVVHARETDAVGIDDARAPLVAGNRVELELDNARARGWLLDGIAASRRSVLLQVYIATEDDVGKAVEAALAAAAARGVTVRVLVDSLHAQHGSFGVENPLLARLATHPGVEVRAWRPIGAMPSLSDLKGRDHRKLVVIDDRTALVGGRNLAHEYYTGFEEAPLNAGVQWREVPWLDGGARVEGPAVAAIAASFHQAWTDAGGAPFAIDDPPPAGPTTAAVIVHHALRDAHTLEAYLDLVARARSHIYTLTGFPLALELQHALVRALERGVRVVVLTGEASPTHDGTPFAGPWSSARAFATDLVHSRLDPLIEAGGEVYRFERRGGAAWDPALRVVQPYVHAKLMSVDGRRCTVGSANLDVTSAYWESELMLLCEDAAVAGELEAEIDRLILGSSRIDRDDPAWRERARRRRWMRRWPGVLSA